MGIFGDMEKSKDAKVLLGRRIRSLRNLKGWTQQKLGEEADVNYKFLLGPTFQIPQGADPTAQ